MPNKMPNEKALSLFKGGEKGVISRMTLRVKTILSNKDDRFLKWFAKEFGLKPNEMKCLKEGKKSIDFRFFEKVQEALDISIHDVLGAPVLRDGEKKRWRDQLRINPMVLAAPGKEPGGEESYHTKEEREAAELGFYVRLRAINELVRR